MPIPTVVYPKEKVEELEALAEEARKAAASGNAVIYDDVEDLIAYLHGQVPVLVSRGKMACEGFEQVQER